MSKGWRKMKTIPIMGNPSQHVLSAPLFSLASIPAAWSCSLCKVTICWVTEILTCSFPQHWYSPFVGAKWKCVPHLELLEIFKNWLNVFKYRVASSYFKKRKKKESSKLIFHFFRYFYFMTIIPLLIVNAVSINCITVLES